VDEPAHAVVALDGAPIDPERDYRIAIVRDLFAGLDKIEPLMRFARERPERVPPEGSGRGIKIVLVEAFSVALWSQLGGFDAVDANHDGVVTEPELEAAIARVTHDKTSRIAADLVVGALDTNHDQVISREEADAAVRPHKPRGDT
jgi:hypothetical protein